jgi:hypothetical protein
MERDNNPVRAFGEDMVRLVEAIRRVRPTTISAGVVDGACGADAHADTTILPPLCLPLWC